MKGKILIVALIALLVVAWIFVIQNFDIFQEFFDQLEGKSDSTTNESNETDFVEENVTNMTNLELKIHDRVNLERIGRMLNPLKLNYKVSVVARMHSEDMGLNDYFDHENMQGLKHADRLYNYGIYNFNTSGENIALGNVYKARYASGSWYGKRTENEIAKLTVDGWMNSTGHRENILKPEFDEEGIGVYITDEYEVYVTQNFIRTTNCGYKTGPCCEQVGYLPRCYIPFECVSGVCE